MGLSLTGSWKLNLWSFTFGTTSLIPHSNSALCDIHCFFKRAGATPSALLTGSMSTTADTSRLIASSCCVLTDTCGVPTKIERNDRHAIIQTITHRRLVMRRQIQVYVFFKSLLHLVRINVVAVAVTEHRQSLTYWHDQKIRLNHTCWSLFSTGGPALSLQKNPNMPSVDALSCISANSTARGPFNTVINITSWWHHMTLCQPNSMTLSKQRMTKKQQH